MKTLTYQHYNMADIFFSELSAEREYTIQIRRKWETLETNQGSKVLELIGKDFTLLFHEDSQTNSTVILDYKGGKAIVSIEDSKINNDVYGEIRSNNRALFDIIYDKVKKVIPVAPEPISSEISVRFWYLSPNGPKAVHRNIAAPNWETISENYASTTHTGLNHLMSEFKPTGGGKLILWHGEPGTGKTYALRALCQEWKKWCSIEYIMDPETLLGSSPGYLASMIMHDTSWDEDEDEEEKPWKLLIMEDTGELLTETARERAGQGLSRLLNVVDGFIGQGLRVLILITTNEEFHTLHPAVSREGRCAASIKFECLTLIEAQEFLKEHKFKGTLDKHKLYTLAELYALMKDENMPRDKTGIKTNGLGFRIPTAQVS